MGWADLEPALVALFTPLVADAGHIGTATPADLGAKLPFLRIGRFGGPRDRVTDFGDIDLDAFARTRAEAVQLLEDALQLVTETRTAGGALLDDVGVRQGPTERPWANTNVRRFGATFGVESRRQQ